MAGAAVGTISAGRGSIEFYFDLISPHGYLASTRIEAIAARYARAVDWKPVLLGITVMKVMGLPPLPQTPLKKDYVARDVPAWRGCWACRSSCMG